MARRLFNGHAFSEDGWPYVDEGSCTWIVVPGTNPPVHLEIQNGPPMVIMGAFAADINAYVEHVRDPDSACWTPGNSVSTSNHPGGTAMDIDWELHRFQISYDGFNQAQIVTCRELLDYYEGMIFWGQDWDSPKDCMHWQMGYNTYDQVRDQPFPKVFDFIRRKIRSDGFSTFRREGVPVPPPPPMSRQDRYATLIINEGRRIGISPRGIMIALSVGLVESTFTNYANSNDPASLNIPHDAVGSDHLSVGVFQQQPPWGSLEDRMDVTRSANIFFTVDHGPGVRGLTKIRDSNGNLYDYNNTANSPGFYAQHVQGSAFPDRYDEAFNGSNRYPQSAQSYYNRLAGQQPPPPLPPPQPTGDDMALVPQDQWDNFFHAYMDEVPSLSPLREPSEGNIGPIHRVLRNIDSNVHVIVEMLLCALNDPDTLARLRRVYATQLPDRQPDRPLAQAILADAPKLLAKPSVSPVAQVVDAAPIDVSALTNAYAEIARLREENARLQAQATPPVSTEVVVKTTGDHAKGLIDSVEDWTAQSISMDRPKLLALTAAIKVLEMNSNGAQQ